MGQLTQTNHIHHKHLMLQRHKLEIHRLHKRPDGPIRAQRIPIRALQFLPRIAALHQRHTRQETRQVRGGEEALVAGDAGGDLQVRTAGEHDAPREEAEPGCGCGAEDQAAVGDLCIWLEW